MVFRNQNGSEINGNRTAPYRKFVVNSEMAEFLDVGYCHLKSFYQKEAII